jgi:hypothetical protein
MDEEPRKSYLPARPGLLALAFLAVAWTARYGPVGPCSAVGTELQRLMARDAGGPLAAAFARPIFDSMLAAESPATCARNLVRIWTGDHPFAKR